ncbi:MAG: quinoprotein glucose dehydrogenase [Microgenomates group bacterium Gr01-1014_5]|nr:MAG: quinoprotein glucose dehydrogenase [Microgenomates group bacterium Gr01-1014_5]
MLKIILLLLSGFGIFYYLGQVTMPAPKIEQKGGNNSSSEIIEVFTTNLNVPWEINFLPDGKIFVTEREGRVLEISGKDKKEVLKLNDVVQEGEGGLLGMTQHPQHEKNGYTYLYYTYQNQGLKNKVVRYSHLEDSLQDVRVIIDNIPGNSNHNGGRIKFGPDDKLYITTGDSQNPSTAQNLNSLAGKILRLNDDGSVPPDNPFSGSPVYSYGHRNPQGLAWDEGGKLWATEHGKTGEDEVNLIETGKNYGWPEISGTQKSEGLVEPFIQSGTTTWAPSGALSTNNKLYFSGLKGESIFEVDLKTREVKEFFKNKFGRIRAIEKGPDGSFYFLTNNRDGRGTPTPDDDRIIRVPAETLE